MHLSFEMANTSLPEDFIDLHLSRVLPAENVHSIYWGY
jgi:hypothetical protein